MKKIKLKSKFTLIELIVCMSILSITMLVTTELYSTAFKFSSDGIIQMMTSNELTTHYNILVKDYKNSVSETISPTTATFNLNSGEVVFYEYKNNVLYRNDIPLINYLNNFSFANEKSNLLKVHIELKNKNIEVKIPSDLYIYKVN